MPSRRRLGAGPGLRGQWFHRRARSDTSRRRQLHPLRRAGGCALPLRQTSQRFLHRLCPTVAGLPRVHPHPIRLAVDGGTDIQRERHLEHHRDSAERRRNRDGPADGPWRQGTTSSSTSTHAAPTRRTPLSTSPNRSPQECNRSKGLQHRSKWRWAASHGSAVPKACAANFHVCSPGKTLTSVVMPAWRAAAESWLA